MNREAVFKNHSLRKQFDETNEIHQLLFEQFREQFNRSLPFADELFDRWEKANKLGFGKGSSIYDSSFVFGKPLVGDDVWIGPFTILDGSGELCIGDNVTISAGVHIYSHDNIKQTLLGKSHPVDRGVVKIGSNTYISPNVIIAKDVVVGDHSVIGANSLVKHSFPSYSIIAGNPAIRIGEVVVENDDIEFKYFKKK